MEEHSRGRKSQHNGPNLGLMRTREDHSGRRTVSRRAEQGEAQGRAGAQHAGPASQATAEFGLYPKSYRKVLKDSKQGRDML